MKALGDDQVGSFTQLPGCPAAIEVVGQPQPDVIRRANAVVQGQGLQWVENVLGGVHGLVGRQIVLISPGNVPVFQTCGQQVAQGAPLSGVATLPGGSVHRRAQVENGSVSLAFRFSRELVKRLP